MFVLLQGLESLLLLYLEAKIFHLGPYTSMSPKLQFTEHQNHPQLQRRLKWERDEEIKQIQRKVEGKFRLIRTDFALFYKALYCLQTQSPFGATVVTDLRAGGWLVLPVRPC